MGKASKKFKKFFKIGVVILLLLVLGFFIYASNYYEADEEAVKIISRDAAIISQDNLTIFSSDEPSDKALIFYPEPR